jgi:hypothetical protein
MLLPINPLISNGFPLPEKRLAWNQPVGRHTVQRHPSDEETSMNTLTEAQGDNPNTERRRYPHLRAIYPDARLHIDHVFHNRHDWAGSPIDYVAHRIIHETYPQLDSSEVRLLVGAIERVHAALAVNDKAH